MTLGDIIKNYTSENSMNTFLKRSGLSKAYTYMLINNRNNTGKPIVPSLSTIQKVADAIGKPFDEVLFQLDHGVDSENRVHIADADFYRHEEEVARQYYENIEEEARRQLDITPEEWSIIEKLRKIDSKYMPFVLSAIDTAVLNSEADKQKKTEGSAS